jgi:hypothetical protein
VRRRAGVGVRCGFHVSIGCCWLWASCLDGEGEAVVVEAAARSCHTAVVVVVPMQVSLDSSDGPLFHVPKAYLVVSILLGRWSRLTVVLVVRGLRALVPVLLWRTGVRQHPSRIPRHSLLTEHRSFAVEAGIPVAVGPHSRSGAAEGRRSQRRRGIVVRDSTTCRVTMCDWGRGFVQRRRVQAEKPNSREGTDGGSNARLRGRA